MDEDITGSRRGGESAEIGQPEAAEADRITDATAEVVAVAGFAAPDNGAGVDPTGAGQAGGDAAADATATGGAESAPDTVMVTEAQGAADTQPDAKKAPSRRRAFAMPAPLRRGVMALCIAGMVFSLAYIGNYVYGSVQQRALEKRNQNLLSDLPPMPSAPVYNPPPSPSSPSLSSPSGPLPSHSEEPPPPPIDYKARFESVLAVNEDFYGLLSIPGTSVENDFVVQGKDNDYYLNNSFEKKRSSHGTLFLDADNTPGFTDKNYVIYGHNMFDGTMFSNITGLNSVSAYLKAPVIVFDTIYGPTYWLIFAAYVCESNFSYFHTRFAEGGFEELLEEIYMRSIYHTNVEVLPSDTVLTLSTCNYTFQDARFTVQARLLRQGEDIGQFEPQAEKNTKQKSYNVPKQMRIDKMPALDSSFTYYKNLRRYYFFRTAGAAIEWYVGTTLSNVQGPYTGYTGAINEKYYTWLASGASYTPYKNFYIVAAGLKGNTPGLFVLRTGNTPGGEYKMVGGGPITPSGVDARWPAVYTDEEDRVIVYYTVLEEGERVFYSVPLSGGVPTRLFATNEADDRRPAAALATPYGTLLLVQEYATGAMYGYYTDPPAGGEDAAQTPEGAEEPGEPEEPVPVLLDLPLLEGRYTVFYDTRASALRYIAEKSGKVQSGEFSMDCVPPPPGAPEDPPPESDPAPGEGAPDISADIRQGKDGSAEDE
ncbi:MAG: class B sortase [Oscillospiraceae bacterium]|jgi:sortase B|nr:class B sortase [Oscillospiraceae bacterium]